MYGHDSEKNQSRQASQFNTYSKYVYNFKKKFYLLISAVDTILLRFILYQVISELLISFKCCFLFLFFHLCQCLYQLI